MRFSTILPAVMATLAMAAPTIVEREATLVQRDYATISNAVVAIQSDTSKLDTAIKGYTSSAQTTSLQATSDALLAQINKQTTIVSNTAAITLSEALKVANQVDALTAVVNTTVNDAIAKKATFVTATAGKRVYQSFVDNKAAAVKFGNAVKSKVPSNAQSIADSKIKGITDALQRGINAFADQNK